MMVTTTTGEERPSKTVLVTGGAGFIGSHTCEMLLARGDNVVIVDEMNAYYDLTQKEANLELLTSTFGADRVHIHRGDICDAAFMGSVFAAHNIELIVHLAARAGVRPSIDDPFLYLHSNSEATLRILELARTHGVPHLAIASSSSVYGGSKKECFSEKDRVDQPVSPYAATKKATEEMAYCYHHLYGLSISMLRFFTVYGPRGRPDMAPYKFLHRVMNKITIDQYGDGTSERDYTYVGDIVDGVVRSLDRPLGFEVFNLGNGRPISLRAFIAEIERQAGTEARINIMPMQPGDVPRTCADISHAQQLLDYHPRTPLEEGLGHTVRWLRSWMADKADKENKGAVDKSVVQESAHSAQEAKVPQRNPTVVVPSAVGETKESTASRALDVEESTYVTSSTDDDESTASEAWIEEALVTPTNSSEGGYTSEGEDEEDASTSSGSVTSTRMAIEARRAGRKIVVGTRMHRLTTGGSSDGSDVTRLKEFLSRILRVAAPMAERAVDPADPMDPLEVVDSGMRGMCVGARMGGDDDVEDEDADAMGARIVEIAVAVHTGPGSNMDGESDLLGEIMDMVSGDLANDLGDTALLDVALPNGPSAPPGPRYVTTGGVAIQLLPVFQWGKFTPALNSLLARAKDVEADGICYASVETQFTAAALDSLAQEVFRASETKTLVAGVAFPGLHAFDAGASRPSPAEGVATKRVPLSGLTSPWNTLALWRVDLVGLVGFPPVADGIPSEGVRAGVEEVTAITLLQTLCSESKAGAKLVRLNDDDASLFTDFRASRDGAEHEGRSAWHADKMRSKLSRAAAQVGVLQRDAAVVTGSVLHVDARHRRPSL